MGEIFKKPTTAVPNQGIKKRRILLTKHTMAYISGMMNKSKTE